MQQTQQNSIPKTNKVEFKLEKDDFEKVRYSGVNPWILKHVFYRKNKILIIIFISLTVIASILGVSSSILIGNAITAFGLGKGEEVGYWSLLMLAVGVGTPALGLLARTFRETLAQRMEVEVRREFYLNLLGKSQSFHDRQRLGDLMAMAANDVRLLNFLISPGFSMLFDAAINIIVPIIIIMAIPSKFPVQLVIIPIVFAVIFASSLKSYVKKLAPLTIARRLEFGTMNSVLNESLDGIEVIKSMSQEQASIEKYRESAIAYRDIGIKSGYVQAKYFPLLYVAIAITMGLTHSIILYNTGEITVIGDIIAYIGILGRLRFPTMASNRAFFIIQRAKAGAERLIDTMTKVSEIGDPENAISKEIEGNIVFSNVSFNYPGTNNKVLKNISFEIKSGQTVAVVGMTGSGKTTLTKLISRLYDINSGEIIIDGVDIRNYSLKSLRDQIAYIEQDVFLFSKSAKENIAFGRSGVSDEQIISAAKEAQAHDFISALPNKYDTEVGERGVQLSGGERQRIAIARAFLSEPSILILDDSSSAIDAKTEEKIQTAITRILHDRTTFLITHRLSQIRWADLIIVLKRGEIVAKGTHKELLQSSEEYRKIFVKRFDKTFDELLGGSD